VVHGDAEPEKGFYYRSDHFNFAKEGVPALNPDAGTDYIGKPTDYAEKVRSDWNEHGYHQPADVVRPDWDLSGVREDLKVFLTVGYRVAQAGTYPGWKPGTEFRARREAMLAGK
jgi:Zn-dependent M28 family amino/carboxypeptidase